MIEATEKESFELRRITDQFTVGSEGTGTTVRLDVSISRASDEQYTAVLEVARKAFEEMKRIAAE